MNDLAWMVIARLTLREAVRRRIVLTGLLLGVVFLAVYSVGFHYLIGEMFRSAPRELQAVAHQETFNFLLLAGLYAVTFLSIAMGALIAADTLAGEINSGTIQTLAAKPIRRGDIVVGKWLGMAALLGMYLLLMGGGILSSVWLQSGYTAPHPFLGLGLIYLESLLTMTVTLMCSSRFSALATGGIIFGLYGLGFIGGWVEQIGSVLNNQAAINIGILSSLIMPSESLWRRAAYEMQSPLAGALGFSPFSAVSVPSPAMVVYTLVYLSAAFIVALRTFQKREL